MCPPGNAGRWDVCRGGESQTIGEIPDNEGAEALFGQWLLLELGEHMAWNWGCGFSCIPIFRDSLPESWVYCWFRENLASLSFGVPLQVSSPQCTLGSRYVLKFQSQSKKTDSHWIFYIQIDSSGNLLLHLVKSPQNYTKYMGAKVYPSSDFRGALSLNFIFVKIISGVLNNFSLDSAYCYKPLGQPRDVNWSLRIIIYWGFFYI